MKDFGCWMKNEIFEWHDFRLLPASQSSMISDLEHVIGKVLAKHQIVCIGLWLQLVWRSQSNGQL